MYSFQTGANRRKDRQHMRLMYIVIFILIVALFGVTLSFIRANHRSNVTADAISARAISEASEAQSAVYRLTQSSGSNTMTLLSTLRSHLYALQSLNQLAANIYGVGTVLADETLLLECSQTITECETRLQAGSVLTGLYTDLRDKVDQIVAGFSGQI